MRKNFGKKTWLYPMPVLIVTTYNEDGTPNAMNAAWGGVYDTDQIMLCLSQDHRTTGNIRARGAFTVNIADAAHAEACDYVGMVSGRKVPDKLARAGLHTERAETVDAPVIRELPLHRVQLRFGGVQGGAGFFQRRSLPGGQGVQ